MDIVGRAAERFGSIPALRMAGNTLSFEEVDHQASSIATLLYRRGVCTGDIVAIAAPNSGELILLLLGLLKAGMIAAPLNDRFPEERLRSSLEKLRPTLLLSGSKVSQISLPGIRTVTIASIIEEAALMAAPDPFVILEEMDRPVTIIHTSASSGEAKAAVHSFANHWYNALGSNENIPFGPGACWLLSLPLYHIGGYALLFRSLISGGALAIAATDETLSHSLRNYPLTHLSLVPTQLYRLLADQESTALLRKLKALLLGGSSAPKSLIDEALRQKIPIYLSYGSTEMGSQIATTSAPIGSIQQESGQLLPYRELSVAGDGELLVKGPCLFQGYLRDGVIQPQTDNDGWFHTSDIGSLSEKGELIVLGRKDNMFISGGENIHPEEIEKALMMIEGIREALVVPVPDKEYGQRPVAFIQTIDGKKNDDQSITEAMHSMIGKLKSPTRYFRTGQWKTLPGSQKIDRGWYKKEASLPSGPSLEP
jgi:o-succinylbenzoate---CoA ligase